MGKESEHCGLQTCFFGIICEAFQYFSVTQVHTIKGADGRHCLELDIIEVRNVLDCFQLIKK